MATHIKILASLFLVFGIVGALVALGLLLLFGGIAGVVGINAPASDAQVAVPILVGVGGLLFVLIALLSIPDIVCGSGLLMFRPWARILGIVLSALSLLHVPLGTLLGIYGLWVLLSEESRRIFENRLA
jgi:hypothetical protein